MFLWCRVWGMCSIFLVLVRTPAAAAASCSTGICLGPALPCSFSFLKQSVASEPHRRISSCAALPRCVSAAWTVWWWAPCLPGSPPRPLSSSSPAARGRGGFRSAADPPSASAPQSGSRTDAGLWPGPPWPPRSHGPLQLFSQRSLGCLSPRRGWNGHKGTCSPWLQLNASALQGGKKN